MFGKFFGVLQAANGLFLRMAVRHSWSVFYVLHFYFVFRKIVSTAVRAKLSTNTA